MGALVDESQYKTIKGFVDGAVAEGADVYVARVPVRSHSLSLFEYDILTVVFMYVFSVPERWFVTMAFVFR
jgi:acyl-CoA reductase-like NAD-dependent aldehyde dehydrogenase